MNSRRPLGSLIEDLGTMTRWARPLSRSTQRVGIAAARTESRARRAAKVSFGGRPEARPRDDEQRASCCSRRERRLPPGAPRGPRCSRGHVACPDAAGAAGSRLRSTAAQARLQLRRHSGTVSGSPARTPAACANSSRRRQKPGSARGPPPPERAALVGPANSSCQATAGIWRRERRRR